jgi:catechol 2,3-dioxygenase-like lactoylglutathione lyase family enzyme
MGQEITEKGVPMIRGISHITLSVQNIQEAFDFYKGTLGFKAIMRSEFSAYFQAGPTWIALVQGDTPAPQGYGHIAFEVSSQDFARVKGRLQEAGCHPWQENKSEGDSFYFTDPSGNKLEIHSGSLESRIAQGKAEWTNPVTWFV